MGEVGLPEDKTKLRCTKAAEKIVRDWGTWNNLAGNPPGLASYGAASCPNGTHFIVDFEDDSDERRNIEQLMPNSKYKGTGPHVSAPS